MSKVLVSPSDDVALVPPRFVACRTLRHAWEPSSKVVGSVPMHLTSLACICLRCLSERIDGINRGGKVIYRRYKYAPGYLRKKGQPKIEFSDYRLQLLSIKLSQITMRPKAKR